MLLATEHLILRDFTRSDFEAFAALVADPEVMRFSLKGPMAKEEAKEYFQKRVLDHYAKYGFGVWAIFLKEDFIGFAGVITQALEGKEEVELGFRLNPKYWGKGYATEACKAICRYAFDELGFDRLISIIDPKNHRSLKVANRVGMHFLKEAIFHGFHVQVFVLKRGV
jgi:RimJ/RimL family protein N-acetyltransferase